MGSGLGDVCAVGRGALGDGGCEVEGARFGGVDGEEEAHGGN